MSRSVRRVLIAAAALAGLVVLAAVALPFLIDVNRFRPLIVARVKEATGRTIGLGNISFRLLPAPALSVAGPITVSDSAVNAAGAALTAEALSVHLSLPDLLRGRFSITSFTLHKPTLILVRDARGRWNFDDLVERSSASPGGPAEKPGATGGPSSFFVKEARLVSGRIVVYDDAVVPGRRTQIAITPVDATVRGWGGADATDIDLSAGLGRSILKTRGQLRSRGADPRIDLNARGGGLRAEDFLPLLPWLGMARPAGIQMSGLMDLDGSAEIPIEHPETMRFKGNLVVNGVSYRDAGMALPFENLSGTLSLDGNRAVWKNFKVMAGSSSLSGTLRVEDFLRPRIGFSLSSPRLDVNEFIVTLMPAAPAGGGAAATPPAASSGGLMDQISGSGRLEVKEVLFQTLRLEGVRAPLSLSRSVFSLKDLAASFYGGSLEGSGSVDVSQAVPRYSLAARLNNVDVEPFLAAYDPALQGLLRGRFTGNLDLGAGGTGMGKILRTARGAGRVHIADGVLTSFSVLKQLAALLEIAGGKGIGRENTPFENLDGHLSIADGRARTEDLTLHSADLDLEGKGWVGLDATLDLDVVARFSEASTRGMTDKNQRLAAFTENGRLVVYFQLKGNLASPAFQLNARAQAGTMGERAKEKLRETLKDRILRQLGQPQPEPSPAPSQPDEQKP